MPHGKRLRGLEQIWHIRRKESSRRMRNKNSPREGTGRKRRQAISMYATAHSAVPKIGIYTSYYVNF